MTGPAQMAESVIKMGNLKLFSLNLNIICTQTIGWHILIRLGEKETFSQSLQY